MRIIDKQRSDFPFDIIESMKDKDYLRQKQKDLDSILDDFTEELEEINKVLKEAFGSEII